MKNVKAVSGRYYRGEKFEHDELNEPGIDVTAFSGELMVVAATSAKNTRHSVALVLSVDEARVLIENLTRQILVAESRKQGGVE